MNRCGRIVLVTSLALLAGCADLFGPRTEELPAGATRIDPVPAYFDELWRQVSNCSGLAADMRMVTFWSTVGLPVRPSTGDTVSAFYQWNARRIVLGDTWLDASHDSSIYAAGSGEPHRLKVIRHEMLHAHGVYNHDNIYFRQRCRDLVSNPDGGE
jgi:hypothetical protein